MNLLLKEKLALVSGSTAGIGLAIAEGLAHICSPLASATNGASLRVDGGVVRTIV